MKRPIVDNRYLLVDWNPRPDGRVRKFKHNRRVNSIYMQYRSLEIALWY